MSYGKHPKPTPDPQVGETLTSSFDPDDPLTYTFVFSLDDATDWDFGDGQTEGSLSGTVQHTYADEGTYTVVASNVTDPLATASIVVTVDVPVGELSVTVEGQTVDLVYSLDVETDWDFGDGETLTAADNVISHTYAEAGSYDITAVGGGASATVSVAIVEEPPKNDIATAPGIVIFTVNDTLLAANYPDAPVGAKF